MRMFKYINNLLLLIVIVYNCVVSLNADQNKTMNYLNHFGFIKGDNESMTDGIKRFQKYAGLFVTGNMDEDTQKMMDMPRCGSEEPEVLQPETLMGAFHERAMFVKLKYIDIFSKYELPHNHQTRATEISIVAIYTPVKASKWKYKKISYNILDYPSYLDKSKVDELIMKAFSEWGKQIECSFVKSSKNALITMTFNYTVNITSMVDIILGTGAYPIFGGTIKFNSIVNWTTNSSDFSRHSLYHVALHEIGHSLGLLHSSYPDSIMSPYFMQTRNARLHNNDIQRITFLYNIHGAQNVQTEHNKLSHTWHVPSLCNLIRFDAIIAIDDGKIYVFNDEKFWLLEGWTEQIIFSSLYPMNISEEWKEVPAKVDAAYIRSNGEIYFFRGHQCWKYTNKTKLVTGYPKGISDEFPGIPNEIDAAMTWQDGHTYFFKENQYWKFDNVEETAVLQGFPKPISDWGADIPNDLDAVIFYNLETYFFKNLVYYKYKPNIGAATARYPRPTAFWWFLC